MSMEPSNESTKTESANRRRLLNALGALGVTVLAGCGGDSGDTTTEGKNGNNGNGNGGMTDTPTNTQTETPTPTEEPCSLPPDPAPLIRFNGVSDGTLNISPRAETISGVITNPYLFAIGNGEVFLEAPSDEWGISNPSGNTFDTLESQSSQNVEWDVSVPAVSDEEFELIASITYEACDGGATAEVERTQSVFVDPYIGVEWQDLAIAPEYYDYLQEDQVAPGTLPSDRVRVVLDLSDWADAQDFQLKFADYWPSDGFGALLERTVIEADGEVIYDVLADTEDELQYIVEDQGSSRWSEVGESGEWRFADGNSFWVYQFDVPWGTSELVVKLIIANGFDIDGRKGIERQ